MTDPHEQYPHVSNRHNAVVRLQRDEQRLPSDSVEIMRQKKLARDRLEEKLKHRWEGDKVGELEEQRRVREYLQKSKLEEKRIMENYFKDLDEW
jgi:hypothetical protein